MTKVLITTKHWDTYEYGYGLHRITGTPSIGMVVTEFESKRAAEKSVELINSTRRGMAESVYAEIIT
jgi:hypothetical protein